MNNLNIPKVPRAFPVFCQKVLPLTFDNSLSYLEFLAHVNAKLNETIDALNNQGAYIEQFYKIITDNFEQLKTDLETEIENNKTEIYAAIDNLRDELTAEISANTESITEIQRNLQTISAQIQTLQNTGLFVNEEITGGVSELVNFTTAECYIYYKSQNSITWTAISHDDFPNIAIWQATVDPDDIGNNEVMFVFPDYNITKGLTVEIGVPNYGLMRFATLENMPGETFGNSDYTTITRAEGSIIGGTVNLKMTALENVDSSTVSALMVSNSVALRMPIVGAFNVVFPWVFGALENNATSEKVYPRLMIDDTLHYNNGVLGVVPTIQRLTQAEYDSITPDPNLLYIVTAVNGDINMYVGNIRMAAAYAVGNIANSMRSAGNSIVGNFEVMEV